MRLKSQINKHYYKAWKGVEDQLIFNNIENGDFKKDDRIEPFTLVAAPNQNQEETKELRRNIIQYSMNNENTFVYEVCDYLVTCSFNHNPVTVTAVCKATSEINIYPGETHIKNGQVHRILNLKEFQSDYLLPIRKMKIDKNANIKIFAVNDTILVENPGNQCKWDVHK